MTDDRGKSDHAHVTILHLTASTFFGGPERQMLGLARALSPGVRTVFASFPEGGRCRPFLEKCRSESFDTVELANDFPHVFRVIDELVAWIRTYDVRVMFTHTYKPNLLGRIAAWGTGIPHYVVSRGWTGESLKVRVYEMLDRMNLRYADGVIAVSAGQAAKVKRCAVPSGRLHTIRNSATLRPVIKALPPRVSLLAAGRLSPEKGFDVLIEAMTYLDPSVTADIYGEGGERDRLQRLIDDKSLSSRITLKGFTKDLNDHFPGASLIVLPSRTEGLPNVALEAAAAGKAIVATAVGGTPEIVRHGQNGWLVPSDDPPAMAAAIRNLLADDDKRTAFGEYGRRLTETEFSFAAQADVYRTLIDRIAPTCLPIASPRRRKLAFVIDELSRAGTESQLIALLKNLDRSQWQPELIVLRGDSPLSQALEPDGCGVRRLGVSSLASAKAVVEAAKLRRHWQRQRPDAVITYFLDSSDFALPIAKSLGIPTVRVRNNLGYWKHATSPRQKMVGPIVRRCTDHWLTNSEDARREMIDRDGCEPERVTVIPNGVDLDRFRNVPAIDSRTPLHVGCVGNLRPVKNIDGLIRAAAQLDHMTFSVAGDGPNKEEYQQLIETWGLQDRFILHGAVTDIPNYLARCPIIVLPSHSESLSNALLEAMAAGRAIVATDVGANRMVLGDSGVIIAAGDDKALADAIRNLANDRDRMIRMGQLAKRRAADHYSRVTMVRKFEAFFDAIISGPPTVCRNPASPLSTAPPSQWPRSLSRSGRIRGLASAV